MKPTKTANVTKRRGAETAVAAVTALFLVFTAGFFVGRAVTPTGNAGIERREGTSVVAVAGTQFTPSVPTPAPTAAEPSAQQAVATEPVAQVAEETPVVPALSVPTPTPVQAAESSPDATPVETSYATPEPSAEPHFLSDGRLRLNLATQEDLETLPGIGATIAERILAYRDEKGAFRTVAELRNVSGIGDGRFAQIKDLVTVE